MDNTSLLEADDNKWILYLENSTPNGFDNELNHPIILHLTLKHTLSHFNCLVPRSHFFMQYLLGRGEFILEIGSANGIKHFL